MNELVGDREGGEREKERLYLPDSGDRYPYALVLHMCSLESFVVQKAENAIR